MKEGTRPAGADADIAVFEFEQNDLSFSRGVRHVVDGVFVVRDRETVEGVTPRKAVLGKYHPASSAR